MEEIIDIFDETQNNIGNDKRSNAHKNGLWHKSIHAYLINSKNQLLMQRRSINKEFYPNVWDGSFAGHIPSGESSVLTAVREAKEEIGLDIKAHELEFVANIKEVLTKDDFLNYEFVDIFYIKKDIDINKLKCQKNEVDKIKFVDINVFEKMVNENDPELFPHYNDYEIILNYIKDKQKKEKNNAD